jgi:hypothetical protein
MSAAEIEIYRMAGILNDLTAQIGAVERHNDQLVAQIDGSNNSENAHDALFAPEDEVYRAMYRILIAVRKAKAYATYLLMVSEGLRHGVLERGMVPVESEEPLPTVQQVRDTGLHVAANETIE